MLSRRNFLGLSVSTTVSALTGMIVSTDSFAEDAFFMGENNVLIRMVDLEERYLENYPDRSVIEDRLQEIGFPDGNDPLLVFKEVFDSMKNLGYDYVDNSSIIGKCLVDYGYDCDIISKIIMGLGQSKGIYTEMMRFPNHAALYVEGSIFEATNGKVYTVQNRFDHYRKRWLEKHNLDENIFFNGHEIEMNGWMVPFSYDDTVAYHVAYNLYPILRDEGRYLEAKNMLTEGIGLAKTSLLKAFLYAKRGEVNHKLHKGGFPFLDDAILDFRNAILLNPYRSYLRMRLARCYYDAGDYENCILLADDFLERIDKEKEEEWISTLSYHDDWSRQAYLEKGRCNFVLERFDDAIDCFKKTLEYDTDSAYVYEMMGRSYRKTENYDLAVQSFNSAILVLKKDCSASGDCNELEDVCNKDNDLDLADNYSWIGLVLMDKGEYENAIPYFSLSLSYYQSRQAYNNRAKCFENLSKMDESWDDYIGALRMENDSSFSHKGVERLLDHFRNTDPSSMMRRMGEFNSTQPDRKWKENEIDVKVY